MIIRICVVVPTYNHPNTINDVLKDVVLKTPFPVLVIDDGSNSPAVDHLYSWDVRHAMETGRIRVLRRKKNLGKGSALRWAIRDLVSEGFTHMLTIDGDGQHRAADAMNLVVSAKRYPWDLIIGKRQISSSGRFSNKVYNFWFTYHTGLEINDSRSGLRLYPLLPIQSYSFFTRRNDFETEILIRMVWNGIHVREVETDVCVSSEQKSLSRFDSFADSLRLTILNTALLIISLLKSHTSPVRLGASTFLGVFIGCTPFFGFHSFFVFVVAAALRLNLLAMFIASNISAPPFTPFLMIGSIYVGSQWLGVRLGDGLMPQFAQWMAGSLIVGLGLGCVVGLITFLFAHLARKRNSTKANYDGLPRAVCAAKTLFTKVLRRGGLRTGYALLYFLVPYFYWLAPRARAGLHEYYRVLEPKVGYFTRLKRIHRHLFCFGQMVIDEVYQGYHRDPKFAVRAPGMEGLIERFRHGEDALVLGAHIGGSNLFASLIRQKGLDRCVALMGDRPLAGDYELIPFFGKLAPFDVTAFRLAADTRAPLLFAFIVKTGERTYDLLNSTPRFYAYSDRVSRELQLYAWAEQYARELEILVRKFPEQWFNLYKFWSALPKLPNGLVLESRQNLLLEDMLGPDLFEAGFFARETKSHSIMESEL